MSKKVLVLYYTQSGQLGEIVNSFTRPFEKDGVQVERVRIKPVNDFAFPWSPDRFFDAMPESVLATPVELAPFSFKEQKYDLVLFAYQPWFLSPSIPANSMLMHPAIQSVLKDTPVITIIGARNMWLNAQEKVKLLLEKAGAKLVGNVALVDKNGNITSAVTIMHWMFGGKKDKYLGVFPNPGVSDEDISNAEIYGQTAADYLQKGSFAGMQQQIVAQGGAFVVSNLMFIEERAGRLFKIWANLVSSKNNRSFWLKVYKYYLLFALFIVAPIVLTINFILFRVFFLRSNHNKKQYYLGLK